MSEQTERHDEDSCARVQTGNPIDSLTASTKQPQADDPDGLVQRQWRTIWALKDDLAALSAEHERLKKQAVEISVALSDAGVNSMTIPEGVRTMIRRAEAAEAEHERLRTALQTLVEQMKAFANTKPSGQQTRAKSAREMVGEFAYQLSAVLAKADAREQGAD